MTRPIVYTRADNRVCVCWPSANCIAWLSNGGRWQCTPKWLEEQAQRHIQAGHGEHAVRRYIRAMQEGGCTTADAYEIIRDRDCGHLGTGHELWSAEDLPDRWFRDAWRRSHNGGPMSIDLKAARTIQFRRIKAAMDSEDKRRAAEIDLFDRPIEIPLGAIRDRIHKAGSTAELRRVWPDELPA